MNMTSIKIVLFVLASLMSFKVKACNERELICSIVCKHDGDEVGILIKDKCFCGNARDIEKIVPRVNVKGKAFYSRYRYEDN